MNTKFEYKTVDSLAIRLTDYVANGSFASLAENVQYQGSPSYAILIRLTDFNNSFRGPFIYVDEKAYAFLNKSSLRPGDIIISNVGANVGTVFLCPNLDTKMTLGPNAITVRFNGIDRFYYYWFLSPKGQASISSIVTGSAQPKFNKTNFKQLLVPVPPLDYQRAVVRILDSIDKKIEINDKINGCLLEQCKSFFENWFVTYRRFGGKAPNDWNLKKLGDVFEVKRGGSPRPIQDYLSTEGYRWLKISDATSCDSPYLSRIAEHIKEEGLKKTVFLHAGNIVLSNSATPGLPKILDVDTCIHDGWLYFPQSDLSKEFMYLLFEYLRPHLLQLGNGSIFTNLKTEILKAYEFRLPGKDVLEVFDQSIAPLFEEIHSMTKENLRLETLRDSILPKLMSGEIDVDSIQLEQ